MRRSDVELKEVSSDTTVSKFNELMVMEAMSMCLGCWRGDDEFRGPRELRERMRTMTMLCHDSLLTKSLRVHYYAVTQGRGGKWRMPDWIVNGFDAPLGRSQNR